MKLNLGSGSTHPAALNVITMDHTGWKSIDICTLYKADEHYDISEGIREKNDSIEEIWMGDFFEHLLRLKALFVIEECFRVLKPGGKLLISVPDMKIVMPLWLESNGTDLNQSILIWGDQDEIRQKNAIPSVHKFGYTETSLINIFKEAGFSKINRTGIHKNWFELALEVYK